MEIDKVKNIIEYEMKKLKEIWQKKQNEADEIEKQIAILRMAKEHLKEN